MNALVFIDQLVKENKISNLNAQAAYGLFVNTVGENSAGTYSYFRTKFNNTLRDMGETIKGANPVVTYDPTLAAAEGEAISEAIMMNLETVEPLPTRRTMNYQNGDELPEIPGLMPTGTIYDRFASDRVTTEEEKQKYFDKTGEPYPIEDVEIGGITRKCVDIVAGDPGAGKTYSRNILGVKAKHFAKMEQDKDLIIHFISGEMRDTEWAKELAGSEMLREVEVTYMLDYVGYPNYEEIFWDAFGYGDIVICDSLPAIISHFKMSWPASKGKMPTETQMIFDFIRKSLKSVSDNNNNVQLINQANKDGNYKGGTELPHMMSSMSFVKLNGTDRYMIFAKNRNNGLVKRKLFFTKTESGDIKFNEEAYTATYEKVNDKKQDLNTFMTAFSKDQKDKLNRLGEGSATEMSPEEMGTDERLTEEELLELDGIPAHLRDDNYTHDDSEDELEDAPVPQRTLPDGQTDLEDIIAAAEFEEREKEIRAIEAAGGKIGGDYTNLIGGIRRQARTYESGDFRNRLRPEVLEEYELAEAIVAGRLEGDVETAQRTMDDIKNNPNAANRSSRQLRAEDRQRRELERNNGAEEIVN